MTATVSDYSVDSFQAFASQLLDTDNQFPNRESIKLYHEDLTRTMLNWMGLGKSEELEQLLESLQTVVQASDFARPLSDLPPQARLAAQLRSYCHVIAVFLRTDNTTKALGVLAGKRNQGRRNIFFYIASLNGPVTKKDISEKFQIGIGTAKATIDRFHKEGWLEKDGRQYTITWSGRRFYKFLRQEADRSEQESASNRFAVREGSVKMRKKKGKGYELKRSERSSPNYSAFYELITNVLEQQSEVLQQQKEIKEEVKELKQENKTLIRELQNA